MHVYFVRHGETNLNAQHMHQSASTPLNKRGVEQARTVGEYLRGVNADLLISSTYVRALETSRIIETRTGLTLELNSSFREVVRPSVLAHDSLYSVRTLWYITLSVLFRNNSKWRYKDGENFYDIHERIQKSFSFLESITEEHSSVIVVSHSVYINLLITYMCNDRKLTLIELIKTLLNINELKNCAVTHVEYVGPAYGNTCVWQRVLN